MNEDQVRLAFLDGFAQGVKAAITSECPLTGHMAWETRRHLHWQIPSPAVTPDKDAP